MLFRSFLVASGSPPPRLRCDTCWQILFLASVHAFAHARHDDVARQEIGGSHRLQRNALRRQKQQRIGDVGVVFEAGVINVVTTPSANAARRRSLNIS